MTNIELIGSVSGKLDTYDDVDIPLTLSIASIKEPGKRSGLYSKTILLPGTTNNNQLLSYYFDVNLDATVSSFNVYRKQACRIIQDGISIYDNLLLKLLRVNKRNNIQTGEQFVEYEVEVKDYSSDFFNQIASKKLEDINLSEFNHTMEVGSIINSWSNTWEDGYIYPITKQNMDNTTTIYPFNLLEINQLRPMIFTKQIFDKIHKLSGYDWKWDDNDKVNVNFQKTIITDNKNDKTYLDEVNSLNIIEANGSPYLYKNYFTDGLYAYWNISDFNESFLPFTFENEVKDYFNKLDTISSSPWIYEKSTGNPYKAGGLVITAPISKQTYYKSQFNFLTTPSLRININGYIKFSIKNLHTTIASFVKPALFDPDLVMSFTFVIVNATTNNEISTVTIGSQAIKDLSPIGVGQENIVDIPININRNLQNVNVNDDLVFYLKTRFTSAPAGASGIWKDNLLNNIPDSDIEVTTIYQANIKISVDGIPTGSSVPLSTLLPRRITQREFINSINTMYNLYVEPNPDNPNQMIYTQRDTYYDNGSVKDWTDKLARNLDQVIEFLPDLTSKSVNFTYKSDEEDELNKSYLQSTKEIWGKQTVDFSSEWVRGTQDVELIFGPSPIESSGFRSFPYIDYDVIKNPKIMINSGNLNVYGDGIYLLLNDGTTVTPVLSCPYISHQYADISLGLDPELNPSFDLNFGINDYYFIDNINPSNLNLYTFWRRTMKQVDNGKQLTAYFDLTPLDMANIKMNDKIKIDNTYWIIDSIIDYNANKKQLTKVKLLSIEDEMRI